MQAAPGDGPAGVTAAAGRVHMGATEAGLTRPSAWRAWLAAAGVAPEQPSDLDVRLWGAMLPAKREEPVRTLLLAVVRGWGGSSCLPPHHHVADPRTVLGLRQAPAQSRSPDARWGQLRVQPRLACAGKALVCTP